MLGGRLAEAVDLPPMVNAVLPIMPPKLVNDFAVKMTVAVRFSPLSVTVTVRVQGSALEARDLR